MATNRFKQHSLMKKTLLETLQSIDGEETYNLRIDLDHAFKQGFNDQDPQTGDTPLHIAARKGWDNIFEWLLEKKASTKRNWQYERPRDVILKANYGTNQKANLLQLLSSHQSRHLYKNGFLKTAINKAFSLFHSVAEPFKNILFDESVKTTLPAAITAPTKPRPSKKIPSGKPRITLKVTNETIIEVMNNPNFSYGRRSHLFAIKEELAMEKAYLIAAKSPSLRKS